jgi:hypothetical protein
VRLRSLLLVEERLLEAEYFTKRLRLLRNPSFFAYNLNAFLSAARSVTFLLQKEMSGVPDFADWWEQQQTALKRDECARFFHELRNFSQKQGRVYVVGTGRRRIRSLGLSVEDVEECLGFPRGWTAGGPDSSNIKDYTRFGGDAVDFQTVKRLTKIPSKHARDKSDALGGSLAASLVEAFERNARKKANDELQSWNPMNIRSVARNDEPFEISVNPAGRGA